MGKKILIHSIAFSPDGVSTAYLYNDIALTFKANGYIVTVLTTTPHYNVVQDKLSEQPLIKRFAGLFYESNFHGIKVVHVPQKKFRSAFLRIFGFLYWHFLSFFLALSQGKISLILSPSPPLTIGLINLMLGKIKGAKVIYNVQEIYPDFLINQGGLKVKPIISCLRAIERMVYNKSDAITTIDSVFYVTIKDRFKEPSKLHVIPNFVDTELFKPISKEEIKLDRHLFPQKEDTIKVMYAGNIGHAQDWEPLLNVAKRLVNSNVEFWVIGEGVMKQYLEEEIKASNLNNIHVIHYQPREQMPSLIAYADLHFIFMSPQMEGQGFPSKVYTIMACAKPLLVISGKDTPIHNFLEPLDCAVLIDDISFKDKCDKIVAFLDKSIKDKTDIDLMGKNGYSIIEKEYSKRVVTQKYVDLSDMILNS